MNQSWFIIRVGKIEVPCDISRARLYSVPFFKTSSTAKRARAPPFQHRCPHNFYGKKFEKEKRAKEAEKKGSRGKRKNRGKAHLRRKEGLKKGSHGSGRGGDGNDDDQ